MSDTPKTCGDAGGKTNAGAPCRGRMNLSEINGLCLNHDPLRKAELRAVRVLGAKAKAAKDQERKAALPEGVPSAPRTLEDAEKLASWISHAVLVGEIHPRVAEAATKACRQFQLTIEKRVLQDRVKDLERELRRLRA